MLVCKINIAIKLVYSLPSISTLTDLALKFYWYISHIQVDVNERNNAVVTPLRKAASYEQRKTNLGSSP